MQISINTTGGNDGLYQANNNVSKDNALQNTSSQNGSGALDNLTVDQLTSLLTTLLLVVGENNAKGLGSKDAQANNNNPTNSNNAASNNPESTELLNDMLRSILNELTERNQNDSGNLFGDSQPTSPEISAYSQGVRDTLNAINNNGYSQVSAGQTQPQFGNDGLNGTNAYNQLGSAVGLGVGQKAGLQELNNVSTHNDSPTRYFVDKEDRAMAKEIGQFMDQYPEVFGKPDYQKDGWSEAKQDDKSWAKALSQPDDDGMTKESMDQFLKAVGMVKSAVAGDTGNTNLQARGNGGSSLGIDAAMIGDRIINMGMEKLAA
nr:type III secretion protein HrpN [Brenneria rubrifaciens]